MKVVYIAGKYRGKTPWDVEQNIQAAQAVAAKVISAGHMPLTPHKNTEHMEGLADDAFFLAGTMELLRRCDAVVLVPGWERSVGARAEVVEANRLGLPVFGRVDSLGGKHPPDDTTIGFAIMELRGWAGDGTRPKHEDDCVRRPDLFTMNPPRIVREETDSEFRTRIKSMPPDTYDLEGRPAYQRRIVDDERFAD